MPYTLVHPGFILPFARWLPKFFYLPALIVGSFIPDFDIIYRFSQTRYHLFTYTTSNIFLEIIPLGIVLTYIFSYILIPISEKGEIDISINTSSVKSCLLLLPKVVLNLIVAIYLHLFLDSYFHIKNIIDISEQIALDLGYGQHKVNWVYYFLLYIPQILISSIGTCLLLFSLYLFRK
ncbi:MAG: DUF4184 family protein, partial [Chitinophagales bacterium]|nr:DUF4184 family protein [Chitinophagales bacterium]